MSKEYNIGIYIRLSMADEDTGYGSKAESDSIGNQRTLQFLSYAGQMTPGSGYRIRQFSFHPHTQIFIPMYSGL